MRYIYILLCLALLVNLCSKDDNRKIGFTYNFETGMDEWTVGYSDYPAGLSADDSLTLYEMSYGHSFLPPTIVPPQGGIRVRGHNRSDDLFMFIKKEINGLSTDTYYAVSFEIEIASNAPTNASGIGGAPGEGVTIKAGAVDHEPENIIDAGNWYRLNIDKGNQQQGGEDVAILGNIGVSDTTTVYTLIERKNSIPLVKKSDSSGNLWVIIGTDSGFEGLTELYYSAVKIVFEEQ
ncbi:MAG: hypothetical protein HPY62_05580 [Bacteroidales bacterium]|nr:hypothetical protein [Bacteroidales bacterium]